MAVKRVRDAIILSMLASSSKSKKELESKIGIHENASRQSFSFLKKSRLVEKKRIRGTEFYAITDNGRRELDNVFRRIGR
ncbi:hypothetical protein HY501_03830 [Candidatus Woesearchaeota archaeon]|nr:hypothetical protein [Candidatus Woesearchaeota archaeon]